MNSEFNMLEIISKVLMETHGNVGKIPEVVPFENFIQCGIAYLK